MAVHMRVDADDILFRKSLEGVEQVGGAAHPARQLGQQGRGIAFIDADFRNIALDLLLHDLVDDEAEKIKAREIAAIIGAVPLKEFLQEGRSHHAAAGAVGRVIDTIAVRNIADVGAGPRAGEAEPERHSAHAGGNAATQPAWVAKQAKQLRRYWRSRFSLHRAVLSHSKRTLLMGAVLPTTHAGGDGEGASADLCRRPAAILAHVAKPSSAPTQ
jgi:hypothetical protein